MVKWKLFTLISVILALLWETKGAYHVAYLSLFLFVIWGFWLRKAAAKLRVERLQAEARFFPQEQGEVKIEIFNPTPFSFAWASLADKIPRELLVGAKREKRVFSLPGRTNYKFSFHIAPKQRGIYNLGPLELAVGDLFGITTQRFKVQRFQTIIVYPEIRKLPDFELPSKLPQGNLQAVQKIYPDPTRLAGVRPYQQGDPLRNLHWPATARTQSLQVKQFEHTITAKCRIYLNLDEREFKPETKSRDVEFLISLAASLAADLLQKGETCGLAANGKVAEDLPAKVLQIPDGQGAGHLTQILTTLAGIKCQEAVDYISLLRELAYQQEPGSTLLLLTREDTPELIRIAQDLVRGGRQVLLFALSVQHTSLLRNPKSAPLQLFPLQLEGRQVG